MWVQNEWKYAWHNYKSDPNREIIIINYDMLDYKNVVKRHIGTFLRLGKYIDFSNHKQLIKEEIASKLNMTKRVVYWRKISMRTENRRSLLLMGS
jgi:hypothetical protein